MKKLHGFPFRKVNKHAHDGCSIYFCVSLIGMWLSTIVNQQCAYIWINYQLTLRKPQLNPILWRLNQLSYNSVNYINHQFTSYINHINSLSPIISDVVVVVVVVVVWNQVKSLAFSHDFPISLTGYRLILVQLFQVLPPPKEIGSLPEAVLMLWPLL